MEMFTTAGPPGERHPDQAVPQTGQDVGHGNVNGTRRALESVVDQRFLDALASPGTEPRRPDAGASVLSRSFSYGDP